MNGKPELTKDALIEEAKAFSAKLTCVEESWLYGRIYDESIDEVEDIDDEEVDEYIENFFIAELKKNYRFQGKRSISDIAFPALDIDLAVANDQAMYTEKRYSHYSEYIYGFKNSFLTFVYKKKDDTRKKTSALEIKHAIFIDKRLTADHMLTKMILRMIENETSFVDISEILSERNFRFDEISADNLAKEILQNPPTLGYLTLTARMHWRLRFDRAIQNAGLIEGIERIV